jgi:hypothetical protein
LKVHEKNGKISEATLPQSCLQTKYKKRVSRYYTMLLDNLSYSKNEKHTIMEYMKY